MDQNKSSTQGSGSLPPSHLRKTSRFITTNVNGKAVFSTKLPEAPPVHVLGDASMAFCYGTNQTPPNFANEGDIATYEHLIANPPPIAIPNGIATRLVDFPPGYVSPMHRTISLDYCYILDGEVELILDSGESRCLLPGDMAVQRAPNHIWKNVSATKWARIVAFAVPAVTGDGLTEYWGDVDEHHL